MLAAKAMLNSNVFYYWKINTHLAGDTSLPAVAAANRLVRRLVYLMELCFQKGIDYIIENPPSSLLFQYRCVRVFGRHDETHCWFL